MLTSMSLLLAGDNLEPTVITEILAVQPSSAWRLGEIRESGPLRRPLVKKNGRWDWYSPDSDRTFGINEHVKQISETFQHVQFPLGELPGVEHAWIDFFMVIDPNDDDGFDIEFVLSAENQQRLAKLGLPIEFTLSCVGKPGRWDPDSAEPDTANHE